MELSVGRLPEQKGAQIWNARKMQEIPQPGGLALACAGSTTDSASMERNMEALWRQ